MLNHFLLNSGDPWGAGDDEICKFDATKTDVTAMTMGFETLPHNDMEAAMEHLANVGELKDSPVAKNFFCQPLYVSRVFLSD